MNLARQWNVLKTSHLEDYHINFENDIDVLPDDCDKATEREPKEKHVSCKNCAICCYRLLTRYIIDRSLPITWLSI